MKGEGCKTSFCEFLVQIVFSILFNLPCYALTINTNRVSVGKILPFAQSRSSFTASVGVSCQRSVSQFYKLRSRFGSLFIRFLFDLEHISLQLALPCSNFTHKVSVVGGFSLTLINISVCGHGYSKYL